MGKKYLILIFLLFLAFFAKDLVFAQDETALNNPLQYTDIKDLIDHIIDFLFTISIPITAILIIIGGFMMITAGGDVYKLEKAKNLFLYTAIGFAIILLSKGFVAVLKSVLGVKEGATLIDIINFFV